MKSLTQQVKQQEKTTSMQNEFINSQKSIIEDQQAQISEFRELVNNLIKMIDMK